MLEKTVPLVAVIIEQLTPNYEDQRNHPSCAYHV